MRASDLVRDMFETMYDAKGIGLVWTQIDVHERLITDRRVRRIVTSRWCSIPNWDQPGHAPERGGLSSVPGIYDGVEQVRHRVWCFCSMPRADPAVIGLRNCWPCIQHGYDHLMGKVFVEYLSAQAQSHQDQAAKARREAERLGGFRARSHLCRNTWTDLRGLEWLHARATPIALVLATATVRPGVA